MNITLMQMIATALAVLGIALSLIGGLLVIYTSSMSKRKRK
jgi:hypothetical protein